MSKRPPHLVFEVICTDGSIIHVLARSPKGAVSVAKSNGHQPVQLPSSGWQVSRVNDGLARLCINRKQG